MLINNIKIKETVDNRADVTIISPKSRPPDWPLQEIDIQFQEVVALSQVKQSIKWLKYIGPEKNRKSQHFLRKSHRKIKAICS